jgi:tetratricopeptide (TPR) repeat protein
MARKAAKLDNSRADPHIMLARIYRAKGPLDKAMAENEKAFLKRPDSKTSYHLASALRSSGRPEEAIALIKKALGLHYFSGQIAYG